MVVHTRLDRLSGQDKNFGDGMNDAISCVCCFCGKVVEHIGHDPCELVILTAQNMNQSWPCHSACFVERIPDLPYIEDGIFFEQNSN